MKRSLFSLLLRTNPNQSTSLRSGNLIVQEETLQRRQLSLSNWLSEANVGGRSGKKNKGSAFGPSKSKSRPRSGSASGSGFASASKSRARSKSRSRGMSSNGVKHDKAANKFVLDLGNNQEAHIDYKSIGRNKLDLYHSEVPVELRGRGIGKALAKGALDHIAQSNMKARLSCSYLAEYAKKFADPKHKNLIEK